MEKNVIRHFIVLYMLADDPQALQATRLKMSMPDSWTRKGSEKTIWAFAKHAIKSQICSSAHPILVLPDLHSDKPVIIGPDGQNVWYSEIEMEAEL
jgi:hypothetical protein